jgi:hypothetical protein
MITEKIAAAFTVLRPVSRHVERARNGPEFKKEKI